MRATDPGPPDAVPWDPVGEVGNHTDKLGTIVLGDARAALANLPLDPFDGAIIDPPYNVGVDFGEGGGDSLPLNAYITWLTEIARDCLARVRKGAMVMTYGYPEILCRVAARFKPENQKWIQWFRYDGYLNAKSSLWTRTHESILVLWTGSRRPAIASMDALRIPYSPGYAERAGGPMGSWGNYRRDEDDRNHNPAARIANPDPRGRVPGDVIYYPTVRRTARSERWFICKDHLKLCPPNLAAEHDPCAKIKHPAQKPQGLSRHLILAITKPGTGRILVPFAGSGSECVAAKRLGVGYYGAELNPKYLAMASAWLRSVGE